jgi:hypothetical protein
VPCDQQIEMTKLIVAFRNFAKAPIKCSNFSILCVNGRDTRRSFSNSVTEISSQTSGRFDLGRKTPISTSSMRKNKYSK